LFRGRGSSSGCDAHRGVGVMDRIISLLAALVGLIALGGAILVHVNGDVQRKELAAEVAELRSAIGTPPVAATASMSATPAASASPEVASVSAEPSSSAPPADPQMLIRQLQDRIAQLEAQNSSQASALAEAEAKLTAGTSQVQALSAEGSAASPVPAASSSEEARASPASASGDVAISSSPASQSSSASGAPAVDCIPTGTRFVGKPGDSFAICKTEITVKIAAVSDGMATVSGVGPIEAGSFGDIPGKGCSVMVFSADATGFADLRVTCK